MAVKFDAEVVIGEPVPEVAEAGMVIPKRGLEAAPRDCVLRKSLTMALAMFPATV